MQLDAEQTSRLERLRDSTVGYPQASGWNIDADILIYLLHNCPPKPVPQNLGPIRAWAIRIEMGMYFTQSEAAAAQWRTQGYEVVELVEKGGE